MKITIETLSAKLDEPGMYPQGVISWAGDQKPEYVQPPSKPSTLRVTNSEEAKNLMVELVAYETAFDEWQKANKERQQTINEIDDAIEAFMEEESGLNSIVPEEYRSNVWSKAGEYGHSSGDGEVYNYLVSLVEIFKIKK